MRGGATLEEMGKIFIAAALQRHGWNRRNAAKELGIHRSALRRKLKPLGIEEPEQETTEQ